MQESQVVQVLWTRPLPEQGVNLRETRPLPAGGAGQHQRQSGALRLAEGLLLPQQTAVVHRQPQINKQRNTHFKDETAQLITLQLFSF